MRTNKCTLLRKVHDGLNIIDSYRINYRFTRGQLFFLDYLIRNGYLNEFKTHKVKPGNLTEEGTRYTLNKLVQNGFLLKTGRGKWKLTDFAFKVHSEINVKIQYRLNNPFRWK